MDYKEKLKEALNSDNTDYEVVRWIEQNFPELKESEDEEIRKALINGFNKLDKSAVWYNGTTNGQILAWLEKQGEQKPADKVEPKFKVGDWVTNGIDFTFQVRSIEDDMYLRSDDYFIDIETADKTFRFWTLQDAKDGDVLSYQNGKWIFIFEEEGMEPITFRYHSLLSKKGIEFNNYCETTLTECIEPATKEQRDQLEKAMADAGYEWDAEHKQLKKIEQNPTDEVGNYDHKEVLQTIINEQNHDWKEEDEKKLNYLIAFLQNSTMTNNALSATNEGIEDWLKSLRPQSQWKPSDEQMEALLDEVNAWNEDSVNGQNLKSLYQDLKKLRGE